MLDAFEGHVTLDVIPAIHAVNADIGVMPRGMISKLKF
jgi:hypothetical protein